MIDIEDTISTYAPEQLAALKFRLQTDFLTHAQFFLAYRERHPFILSPHHLIMTRTLERVISGEITRLIINIPPGYTKTEMVVIQFCAFCFSFNPACRFMHISGGNTLPLLNSTYIKQQITSPVYQKLWGLSLRDDTKAKILWRTKQEGMFYAVSSGSQILGFRAGRMIPGFQGALLIDDPQKLSDVQSPVKVEYFPSRYRGEIRHRIAWRQTPIIFIMQRLGDEDICQFLLEGGSGEMWHHLCLPAVIP